MNEQELVSRVKEGNEEAFTTLYYIYSSKVFNFTRLYVQSTTESEEIVQEVFCKLWESRELLNQGEDLNGYLFIITRNIIFNQDRKCFNENVYKMAVLRSAEEAYEIEEEMDAAELQNLINKLIAILTPRQQEIFKMSRSMHLSNREIAERLSISEKTVENHINGALKFLRKNIQLYLLFLYF